MLTFKATKSRELVEGIRERVSSTLNVNPKEVTVDCWRFSGDAPSILHCRGSAAGMRFFAKIFLADPYPVVPRVAVPWEEVLPPGKQTRSLEEQIETEWNITHKLRALAGPGYIAAPLAKSKAAKTLVWQEVMGARLDHWIARSRWADPRGNTAAAALFHAGAWLRRVHDASPGGSETVDTGRLVEVIPRLAEKNGLRSSRYAEMARSLIEAAVTSVGHEGKMRVPLALNHGDFSSSNLIWNKKASQLFVVDFEHAGHQSICHDLLNIVFDLRVRLLNPLIPQQVILASENSFWAGYGPIPRELSVLVGALASSRIFYHSLPRLLTRRERRGWLAGAAASLYKALFEHRIVTRRLEIASGPAHE